MYHETVGGTKISPKRFSFFCVIFDFISFSLKTISIVDCLIIEERLMGRFVILSALLLGLIGAVNGQTLGFERRREYAEIGCSPGARCNDCPAKMECFKDARFEKGGRCDCKFSFIVTFVYFSSFVVQHCSLCRQLATNNFFHLILPFSTTQ